MAKAITKARTRAKVVKEKPGLVELALRAVTQFYEGDKSHPGLVMSWLEDKEVFYVSVVRYEQAFGQGKFVLANAMDKTLDGAVTGALRAWREKTSSLRELDERLAQANNAENYW